MTRVYGASDDLIEVDGDIECEFDCYNHPTKLAVSDGTALTIQYGKPEHGGVWAITVVEQGPLFERLEVCTDEDARVYSDIAHFKVGVKWVHILPER